MVTIIGIKKNNFTNLFYNDIVKCIMIDLENFDIYEQNQIIDGKYIGYHHDLKSLPIKRGDIITIKKGAPLYSMKYMKKYIAKKTYKVKVSHLQHGMQYMDGHEKIVENTSVAWAGSGGYWSWIDINEVIEPKIEFKDFLKEEEFQL